MNAHPPRLVRWELLDPRPAEEAARRPFLRAVNIPVAELPGRTYELPARRDAVQIADVEPWASAAAAWLEANGRRGRVVAATCGESSGELGRLWEPTAFLAEVLPALEPAAALDVACGTGRDAVFMSSQGWDVTAVDILPDALERGAELAHRYAAGIRPIAWVRCDLEEEGVKLAGQYDLITVFRYLHRPLVGQLRDLLRPGGSIICETFTTVHRERHGKPARDAHVLHSGELARLFDGLEVRHSTEAWRGDVHTARLWATRR